MWSYIWRLKNNDQAILKKQDFRLLLKHVLDNSLTPSMSKCRLVPGNLQFPNVLKDTSGSDVLLDSEKHVMTVHEKFIYLKKLSIFRDCKSTLWIGGTKYSSLFNIWQNMRAIVNRQAEAMCKKKCTRSYVQVAMDLDASLMPADDSFSILNSSDLDAVMGEAEVYGDSLPRNAVEAITNDEIDLSHTPSNLLSYPFKKCLVCPV